MSPKWTHAGRSCPRCALQEGELGLLPATHQGAAWGATQRGHLPQGGPAQTTVFCCCLVVD